MVLSYPLKKNKSKGTWSVSVSLDEELVGAPGGTSKWPPISSTRRVTDFFRAGGLIGPDGLRYVVEECSSTRKK